MSSRLAAAACGMFAMLALAACSAAPGQGGSCSLGLAPDVSDGDAIAAVIRAEGQMVVDQQIDALMALWAEGASITNAKNTPLNDTDDQFWRDKDAIRHRYVRTVFPGAPQQAAPADLQIERDGDRAIVIATTQIGAEVSPAGDRWMVVKRSGCWLLDNLTYNLEPQP